MKATTRRSPRAQGAALLMAMVTVALVATLAAGMTWQQWRAVQVESAERARVQAAWILTGALDWARLILREDARADSSGSASQPPHDHLGEPWATPLEEARLSTFLAADPSNNVAGGPEAFLAGRIQDAQARYNLRNLVSDEQQLVSTEVATLERLCDLVEIPPEMAMRVARGLRASWSWKPLTAAATPAAAGALSNATDDNADRPLRVERLEQLMWLGVDANTIQRLRPFVDVLPVRTPVNVNTASREVLAAVLNIDAGSAERLVRQRQRGAYTALDKVRAQLPENTPVEGHRLSVQTGFFWVSGRLRLEERVLEERSLVQRRGTDVVTLMREKRSDMALSAWMPTEPPR